MTERRAAPQRTCIACRREADQEQMLRFVLAPDGRLVADYRRKLPGRGAYTCCRPECLERAVQRKAFRRALRSDTLSVDAATLLAEVRQVLEQRLCNLLGIARKSGQLLVGASQVTDALKKNRRVGVLVVTADAAPATADKVLALAEKQRVETVRLMDKAALGALCGKSQTSAVGVESGDLATSILNEVTRFREFEVR